MSTMVRTAILLFATSLPLAAQAPPAAAPGALVAPSPVGDTAALAKQAEGWLADLIRINTTNPPGNEQAAAKYIVGILEKEGITPETLEVAPGRSAVLARLRSAVMPDPSRAVLLVAHMDVVGVSFFSRRPMKSRAATPASRSSSPSTGISLRPALRSMRGEG